MSLFPHKKYNNNQVLCMQMDRQSQICCIVGCLRKRWHSSTFQNRCRSGRTNTHRGSGVFTISLTFSMKSHFKDLIFFFYRVIFSRLVSPMRNLKKEHHWYLSPFPSVQFNEHTDLFIQLCATSPTPTQQLLVNVKSLNDVKIRHRFLSHKLMNFWRHWLFYFLFFTFSSGSS